MTIDQSAPIVELDTPRAKVMVGIDLTPPRQNRLSVLFRLVLVLPLAFVLVLYAIAAEIVLFLSWFAALFTGRVPDSFHDFLTNYQRFSANVAAYEFLLTPKWPGINFAPSADEQVSLEIPNEKQNRLSIFFRGLLSFPAVVISMLWNLAHVVLTFVMWLCILVKGRAPRSLHQYGALWLRYAIRFGAYNFLLTSAQPWHGLRGDGIDISSTPSASASDDAIPELSPESPSAQPATLSEWPPVNESALTAALPTQWLVTPRARKLVNWSFPIGGLLLIGYFVLIVVFVASTLSQAFQVTNSYDASYKVGRAFFASVQSCTTVSCVNQAAQTAHSDEVKAAAKLTGGFSGGAASAYVAYSADLRNLTVVYAGLTKNSNVASIRMAVSKLQTDFVRTQADAAALLIKVR